MKAIEIKISVSDREKALAAVTHVISTLDDSRDYMAVIKNYDPSKTARQRRLDWRWNSEIASSGLGRHDDPKLVHLDGKWLFARPLLLSGEDEYSLWVADMWKMIIEKAPYDKDRQKAFFVNGVHTERMSKPIISQYLQSKQRYWTRKGVILTDPSLAGL